MLPPAMFEDSNSEATALVWYFMIPMWGCLIVWMGIIQLNLYLLGVPGKKKNNEKRMNEKMNADRGGDGQGAEMD